MLAGRLIATGRDCDLHEAAPGRVLRRARDGRGLEREASVMRHARRHGFPVPRVYEADGPDILMERVDGPTMLDDLVAHPSRAPSHARTLADLHHRLAAVRAPGWLPATPGCHGRALLHLDLHPLNVLLADDGPRVIDWANASRGAPGADAANTWLVLATATAAAVTAVATAVTAVAVGPPPSQLVSELPGAFLDVFLDAVGRDAARPYLAAVAERRRMDRNTSDAERAAIGRLLEREILGRSVPDIIGGS